MAGIFAGMQGFGQGQAAPQGGLQSSDGTTADMNRAAEGMRGMRYESDDWWNRPEDFNMGNFPGGPVGQRGPSPPGRDGRPRRGAGSARRERKIDRRAERRENRDQRAQDSMQSPQTGEYDFPHQPMPDTTGWTQEQIQSEIGLANQPAQQSLPPVAQAAQQTLPHVQAAQASMQSPQAAQQNPGYDPISGLTMPSQEEWQKGMAEASLNPDPTKTIQSTGVQPSPASMQAPQAAQMSSMQPAQASMATPPQPAQAQQSLPGPPAGLLAALQSLRGQMPAKLEYQPGQNPNPTQSTQIASQPWRMQPGKAAIGPRPMQQARPMSRPMPQRPMAQTGAAVRAPAPTGTPQPYPGTTSRKF